MGHDKDRVRPRCVGGRVALSEVAEFFSKRAGPYVSCDGIINQLFVFGDGFARDRVNDWGAKMFTRPRYGM